MPDVDLIAVLVSTVVLFVIGSAYYALLTKPSDAPEQPAPWKLGIEVLRCLILATVVAGLAAQGEIDDWSGGLALGLALWIGFPLVLWTGAIIWENTPGRQAALHGGDWLAKLVVVGVLVSVW